MSNVFLPLIAIMVIAGLEVAALSHGLDGTILSMSVATIAGIAGYSIKSTMKK